MRAKYTRIHRLGLEDMQGGKNVIQAIGMDSLMDAAKAPEAWRLTKCFPQVVRHAIQAFYRPYGNVQVLLPGPGHLTPDLGRKQARYVSTRASLLQDECW